MVLGKVIQSVVAAAAVMTAACGGGGEDAAPTTTTEATTTTAPAVDVSTEYRTIEGAVEDLIRIIEATEGTPSESLNEFNNTLEACNKAHAEMPTLGAPLFDKLRAGGYDNTELEPSIKAFVEVATSGTDCLGGRGSAAIAEASLGRFRRSLEQLDPPPRL